MKRQGENISEVLVQVQTGIGPSDQAVLHRRKALVQATRKGVRAWDVRQSKKFENHKVAGEHCRQNTDLIGRLHSIERSRVFIVR